ncbi:MAG: hypothetical protein OEW58_07860 [Gammaproteobacteria bacterium]|nr:hypothetical protein [Gammaproteobacteria bacterium]
MTKWALALAMAGVLLLSGTMAVAKPLPPFDVNLEPVEQSVLPAAVRFVANIQSFQDLKGLTFAFILPPGVTTSAQTEWPVDLVAGAPQRFELILNLSSWPAQAVGAQLRLIDGNERYVQTEYFVMPGASKKAERSKPDTVRERHGQMVRERAL